MASEEKINHVIQNLRLILDKQPSLQILTNRRSGYKAVTRQNSYNIEADNLRNDGEATIFLLRDICNKKQGMFITKINLSNLSELFSGEQEELSKKLEKNKHSFAIVGSNKKMYIVDCAYRQFFSLTYNIDSQELNQMDPGILMLEDEKRKRVAEQILKQGYIELTEENLKLYLDGFVLAAGKGMHVETPTNEQYRNILTKRQTIQRDNKIYESQEFSDEDSKKYIITSEPYICDNRELEMFGDFLTEEQKLTIIVQGERDYLRQSYNLNKASLAGECMDSTRRVILDCISKGFDSAMFLTPRNILGKGYRGA